jgi:putative ABC transport system substrate-binding protein
VSVFTTNLEAKRLEMLHELVPQTALIGVLLDRNFSDFENQTREVRAAAQTLGREIRIETASSDGDLDKAVAALVEMRVGGMVVGGGPFFLNRRERLLELSARYGLPAIYESREFTVAGGLMSYGTSVPDVYRQIGLYVGRVLKGERPADLPVLQPTKFDTAINLKTAKALGLRVPTSVLLRADEVIE